MPKETPSKFTKSDQLHIWILRNRGVCSRIARELGVTDGFVRQVLHHPGIRSTDLRVEKALLAAGAPFMAERIKAA